METSQVKAIREKLRPIFEKAPVHRAILFGSYARGEEEANSDVDIVIDSRGQLVNLHFYGLLEDVVEALNKEVDLFEIVDIKNNDDFMNSVEKEGIVLYEREGSPYPKQNKRVHQ